MPTKKQTKKETTEPATTGKHDPNKFRGGALPLVEPDELKAIESAPTNADHYDPQRLNDLVFQADGDGKADFRELRNLADLAAATGYFGNLTPAQIAFQILAGQELGFTPVASLYNLQISPGKIELAGSQPRFLVLADAIDFHKFVFGEKLTKRQTDAKPKADPLPSPAEIEKCDFCKKKFPAKDSFNASFILAKGGELQTVICSEECCEGIKQSFWDYAKSNKGDLSTSNPESDPFTVSEAKKASDAAKNQSAPIICPKCLKQKDGLYYQADFDKEIFFCSPTCSINATQDFKASKRSEKIPELKPIGLETNDQPGDQLAPGDLPIVFDDAAPASGVVADMSQVSDLLQNLIEGNPGAIGAEPTETIKGNVKDIAARPSLFETPIKSDENEKSNLKEHLSKNPRNDVKPDSPAPEPDEKDAEKVNIETVPAVYEIPKDPNDFPKTIKGCRKQISEMIADLNFAPDTIKEKLAKFDSFLGIDKKRDYLVSVETHYDTKLAAVKRRVFEVMDDPAQFLYQPGARKDYFAENLLKPDPMKWSYQDYLKLQSALENDNILPKTK